MFESYTPQSLWRQFVSELDTDLATNEGSFLYDMVVPALLEVWKVYLSMNALEPMFYVDETSGPYIDKMAAIFDITRKAGTKAVCAITFTGTPGTIIPAGASFLTSDGLSFLLDAEVTLTAEGGAGTLTAAETGAKYNISAGDLIRSQISYYGLTAFSNESAGGGSDEETDAALVSRLYGFLQKPPTSGNAYHYQNWAMEISGVGGALVIGVYDGPGTVRLFLVGSDMGPVDEVIVAAASRHIEEERPVGATVTCQSAHAVDISVSATLTLSEGKTAAAVSAEFTEKLSDYLTTLVSSSFLLALNAFSNDIGSCALVISYNKIAALLVECEGVLDYQDLVVNGGTEKVTLNIGEIPAVGEVDLT